MIEAKEISIPVTVQFEDVDAYRIAHHTSLIAYLERVRVHLLSRLGVDFMRGDVDILLHSLEMKFIKTARLLDQLEVSVAVRSPGPIRLVLDYKIRRRDDLIARATTDLVFIDSKTGELIPVPDDYLDRLRPLVAEPAGGGGPAC